MKRFSDETQAAYRARRKAAAEDLRNRLKGAVVQVAKSQFGRAERRRQERDPRYRRLLAANTIIRTMENDKKAGQRAGAAEAASGAGGVSADLVNAEQAT